MTKFNECFESDAAKEIKTDQINTGKVIGVNGVQFLFIYGKKVKFRNCTEVIKAVLKRS